MVEATLGNSRFFRRSGPFPLAVVASTARGVVEQVELLLEGVAPLQTAGPNEVSFLDNRRYVSALEHTLAGAVIVHPDLAARVPTTAIAIVTSEPYAAWARVAALFYPLPPPSPGIHRSAFVADGARIDPSAEIGPLCVIEAGAEIGPGCWIGPCAAIGRGVIVGRDCRIGAHVSLSHALLGARVYVYPGARIGQEGFGFAYTKDGFLSVPQLGRVILEDDVEVGANTTIDRGSSQDTMIGAGSRQRCAGPVLRHRLTGRYFGFNRAWGLRSCGRAGGPGWASSDRRTRGDRCAGGRHIGFGSRCQSARKPSSADKGLLQANCHARENGKETSIGSPVR